MSTQISGRNLGLKSSVITSKPCSRKASAVEPVPEKKSRTRSLVGAGVGAECAGSEAEELGMSFVGGGLVSDSLLLDPSFLLVFPLFFFFLVGPWSAWS